MAPPEFADLILGPDQLGRVDEIELDDWVGWFRRRWAPARHFEGVRELFATEQALARGQYDAVKWRASWETIWSHGVHLVFPDGSRLERDFVVEIEDENKAWLSYWRSDPDRPPPRASVGPGSEVGLPSISDPAWRQAVDRALLREGELVCMTMRDSIRRWFLVHDQPELERVLSTVASIAPWGKSDAIVVVSTSEFPHRGRNNDLLRATAKEIAGRSWVLIGSKREGDPELHHVEAFDEPEEVDEWFKDPHGGTLVVGEDPFCRERAAYPVGDEEFFAYGLRADGTVLPGSF